ncbi:UNKNOWN [Stylonychia lemnae]|uniref:Uncharacterized protein n=1 Tax=Stylonychia lemnae TaxID=5949 RepID=A0A078AK51_STYLE|nr:UNKNOWN [Stylonychia lemnae]|eukprot:CDW82276.1 UNKNOWN [Stylonychia lemnae]
MSQRKIKEQLNQFTQWDLDIDKVVQFNKHILNTINFKTTEEKTATFQQLEEALQNHFQKYSQYKLANKYREDQLIKLQQYLTLMLDSVKWQLANGKNKENIKDIETMINKQHFCILQEIHKITKLFSIGQCSNYWKEFIYGLNSFINKYENDEGKQSIIAKEFMEFMQQKDQTFLQLLAIIDLSQDINDLHIELLMQIENAKNSLLSYRADEPQQQLTNQSQ